MQVWVRLLGFIVTVVGVIGEKARRSLLSPRFLNLQQIIHPNKTPNQSLIIRLHAGMLRRKMPAIVLFRQFPHPPVLSPLKTNRLLLILIKIIFKIILTLMLD